MIKHKEKKLFKLKLHNLRYYWREKFQFVFSWVGSNVNPPQKNSDPFICQTSNFQFKKMAILHMQSFAF